MSFDRGTLLFAEVQVSRAALATSVEVCAVPDWSTHRSTCEEADMSYPLCKSRFRAIRHWDTWRVFALVLLIVSGCAGEQRAKPVDVELARTTLTQVLEHWKNGGGISDFRSQSPEIVIQETFWSSGHSLLSFTLVDARAEDANWFCDVELTLTAASGGQTTKKTVTYAVGTDPVLTVFRAML